MWHWAQHLQQHCCWPRCQLMPCPAEEVSGFLLGHVYGCACCVVPAARPSFHLPLLWLSARRLQPQHIKVEIARPRAASRISTCFKAPLPPLPYLRTSHRLWCCNMLAGAGTPLRYQDFTGQDLSGKKFYKADMRGADFSGAKLQVWQALVVLWSHLFVLAKLSCKLSCCPAGGIGRGCVMQRVRQGLTYPVLCSYHQNCVRLPAVHVGGAARCTMAAAL